MPDIIVAIVTVVVGILLVLAMLVPPPDSEPIVSSETTSRLVTTWKMPPDIEGVILTKEDYEIFKEMKADYLKGKMP